MRHRCFFFLLLHRLHSGYFFQYIDSHDLTRLGSLYQSCFSESAGTEFADCVEVCTAYISLLCPTWIPSEVPTIHRDGDRRKWHSVLWHSPLYSTSEESCKRKKKQTKRKEDWKMPCRPNGSQSHVTSFDLPLYVSKTLSGSKSR